MEIFDNIFTEINYTSVTWSDEVIKVGQYNDSDSKKLSKQQDSYRV